MKNLLLDTDTLSYFFRDVPSVRNALKSSLEEGYIGQSNNLEDRILRHNGNRNKWTKNKDPWKLIFACQFDTRSEAVLQECFL